ncbi:MULTISPECIES: UDP-N-acetylmuramoyl-tripeptide--D-alanyl-D-alanine ligase [Bacteroides]|uniref:UDP-N-acetylmuramoyl-tripeptide--D-alanyl-D- alanine ligase n=1 Tax=Bacteroides TaxID=816 RepID=UPI001F18BAC6|nr:MULTISPECIES: UDP-N-acetylmuramoyl-tripeptide--D-alanyl-D-alanine ligase [Bacteroides]MCE9074802.1 UDP-N-acetylmuramoyl-tripeptide--D-alanyl-D-alanine ligase [Bacteroides thetaiotaomicron]MCM0684125.1 UDP-N-acetylmuramoyl-tripeptide--D-alanyl-D-alanine ligase [Bacteroides sp. B1-V-101]MCS2600782.1 UDP-N-acetylmuramoyl-tripeptide--D-alanyl-D-alanine ligase [Bacteroides thetaiotaomicron]
MKLSALYQIFLDCQLVTTDSRNCPEGSLFIALKGESFNGNAFAGKALETGCAYAVIDESEYAIEGDQRYIFVDDCLQTLQQLANYHRCQLGTRVIGITGTNGKTTTKELISAVLSQSHNILYTLGNLNNHIGVPSTLLRLKAEHDLAVIEMGANHPGEIKFLSEIVEPDCGIITNVGKAHLEGFGSFEGVIKTKGELYDFLRKKEGSTVFIHHDNAYLMNIAGGVNLIPYGTEDDLYVNGRIIGNSPYLTFEWKAGKDGKSYQVQTQLIGEYNFPNALAAITIGRFFGVEDAKINEALAGYTPQNNRSQLKKTDDNTLIIDAYNANPTSMMAALQNFRNMEVPHKMLILGDMRELGAESAAEHQKIADYLKECAFEKVWLVGDQFAAAEHSFQTYPNVQEVIKELEADKPKGYTILIKGSNGIKLSSVVDYL